MTKSYASSRIPSRRQWLILSAWLIFVTSFLFASASSDVYAAVSTAISPTGGTGSPGSLGTVITSGTSTAPTNLCTANCVITGGYRAGNNLFHSFGDFSIGALDSARFQTGLVNPLPDASVSNILGRVTGGNPSNIFGTLNSATYYPSANLFLMNPAGIVFGPNAVLNVGGSVAFTTANYLRLGDGKLFNAIPDAAADVLLSAAPVAAFGFLGPNAASIVVQGSTLQVAEGQTLALIGGNGTFQSADTGEIVSPGVTIAGGTLLAPSGRILLASVDSAGEVIINSPGQVSALNVASFSKLGKVTLSEGAHLDASTLTDADGLPISTKGNGTVQIRAGELVMDSASITVQNLGSEAGEPAAVNIQVRSGSDVSGDMSLQNGSAIQVLTMDAPGGDILLDAHAINLTGASLIQSYTVGAANGGAIIASASDKISISEFSEISSFTFSSGNGGTINLSAKSMDIGMLDPISGGSISSTAADIGNGGDIALTIQQDLNVRGGGFIGSSGGSSGAAGRITMDAGGTITLSGLGNPGALTNVIQTTGGVESSSRPGDVSIHAGKFVMNNQAQINSEATTQHGADVTITAEESVMLSGGSRIRVGTADQAGGTVFISGPIITLDNASIRTRTVGVGDATAIDFEGSTITLTKSEVTASSGGSGQGGPVSLKATDTISISGQFTDEFGTTSPGGVFTTSSRTGPGGNITLTANAVTLENGGTLSAKTSGSVPEATGGTIAVNANQVQLNSGATITTATSGPGNAGDILVKADTFNMSGGATITAASTGSGNAGNVTIQGLASPAHLVLIDGFSSGIFTDTQGTGAGGNIFVNANSMTLQNGGTLSAKTSGSSLTARGGSINVNATNQVTMTGGALITASSTGAADAGNITINAGNTFMMTNSSVITKSDNAGGGNIAIRAVDQVRLVNSLINASAYLDGGNITIDPNSVILQNSQILAQAIVGNGGAINIFTPLFLADQTSLVDASSQFGLSGPVNIQSPTSNLAGSIASLPSSLRQTQSLQTGRCAALHGETSSSFVVAGRETIPTEPGGWVISPIASLNANTGLTVRGDGEVIPVPHTDEMQTVSLRRLTPIGFLTQYFAESAAIGCRT